MSSTSSSQSRHDPTAASSSKSTFQAAPVAGGDEIDDYEDQDVTDDLLADDPFNGTFVEQ